MFTGSTAIAFADAATMPGVDSAFGWLVTSPPIAAPGGSAAASDNARTPGAIRLNKLDPPDVGSAISVVVNLYCRKQLTRCQDLTIRGSWGSQDRSDSLGTHDLSHPRFVLESELYTSEPTRQ